MSTNGADRGGANDGSVDAGDPDDGPADGGETYPGDMDVRERYVCYCLSEHGPMALWDLADEVTVWETGARLPDLPASEGRKVYLALYHTHVPRLERAGHVDYRPDRDLVVLSEGATAVPSEEPAREHGTSGRVQFPYER